MLISYSITVALIVFWALPVAFIGIISNVHSLCATYSWLAWLCKLPGVVVGIISGILPPLLLVVLMILLPIILRYVCSRTIYKRHVDIGLYRMLAQFEGIPKKTGLELSVMDRYFVFQVIVSSFPIRLIRFFR
jgi:hypothetical protein